MSLWSHQMETFSALLALCEGNPPVTSGFPSQRPVTWSFDAFFDLHLNKWLIRKSRRRWFETPSRSLWPHCNGYIKYHVMRISSMFKNAIQRGVFNISEKWIGILTERLSLIANNEYTHHENADIITSVILMPFSCYRMTTTCIFPWLACFLYNYLEGLHGQIQCTYFITVWLTNVHLTHWSRVAHICVI